MKTVLVTGGAGFIGSNFILYLLNEYPDVRVVSLDSLAYAGNLQNCKSAEGDPRYDFVRADIGDRRAVRAVFSRHEIGVVVNFAAQTHVDRSIIKPGVFAKTNVLGTLCLLDAAREAWRATDGGFLPGVRFVQVSTDEVYGSLGKTGVFSETSPLDPHSPYSASKAAADLFVGAYAATYGLPVNITRCTNNYGPFQYPEKLVPLMIYRALRHEELPVYGDGLQVRDWLYVEDHCRAIDAVAQGAKPGEIYNIGAGNERTNLEMVKTVLACIRRHADPSADESQIRHVRDREGHDRRYAIDAAKIRRDLGWAPVTPFEAGIEKTVRWYLDNGAWLAGAAGGAYEKACRKIYAGR